MVRSTITVAAVAAGLGLLSPALAQGFYPPGSPVLELANEKEFESLVAKSNHTSIVEFYAPWCGHCRNLKPAYEKAAKALSGLAKVAAVNCDEESNKRFCGSLGVQGFPTLKIVRPSKRAGKPQIEDYQGARTAKGITEAVKDKISNHVKRLSDDNLDEWLAKDNDTAKAIFFSTKGATAPLIKSIAIDYLGVINVAQVRDKEKAVNSMFGIEKYPSMVVLPGGSKDPLFFTDDKITKTTLSDFLMTIALPNPDPAIEVSGTVKKPAKAAEQKPIVPAETPVPSSLPSLDSADALQTTCLSSKSHLCVLVLPGASVTKDTLDTLPDTHPEVAATLKSMAEIHYRHTSRGKKIPPFYVVPAKNPLASELRSAMTLKMEDDLDIVAVNGKRGWLKRYHDGPDSSRSHTKEELETWIDMIKMGEGQRESLSDGLVVDEASATRSLSSSVSETLSKESQAAKETDDGLEDEMMPEEQTTGQGGKGTAGGPETIAIPDHVGLEDLTDEEVAKILEMSTKPRKAAAPEHGEL